MAVIFRVRTTLTYGSGGPGLHTAYWLPGTAGGTTADATDCVARVRAMWNAWAPNFASSFSALVQTDVTALEATTGVLTGLFSGAAVAVVTGSGGVLQTTTAAMALVRARTASVVNGRLLRGRWYVGPLASGAITGTGQLVAATGTLFNTGANGLITPGATPSLPVVWHRPQPAGLGSHALVTSYSTWNELAVLRSRRDP